MPSSFVDRRRFPRFDLPPAYSGVALRRMEEETFSGTGHAVDISEGGIRFEADVPIEPGQAVALRIDLPGGGRGGPGAGNGLDGPGNAIFVVGNVVWCEVDEVGSARMALAITRFCRDGDKRRLLTRFGMNELRRAA